MKTSALHTICFVLFPLAFLGSSFGQGCNGWMTPSYSIYISYSNSGGTNITTSVYVDGTTNGVCPIGCGCTGVTHTPQAYNKIGSTGGWKNGTPGPWNSFIAVQNPQAIMGVPGVIYLFGSQGDVLCTLAGLFWNVGNPNIPIAGFTPVQHTYPNNPLSNTPCWISRAYDAITGRGVPHKAQDVIKDGGGTGANIAYGTPVYAAESGTVTGSDSSKGPASYPACKTQSPAPQPNFVKIKGSDGYYTVYAHVKPTVTQGTVTAGQQIGVTDPSGCQSNAHIHMTRRDANGNNYNFHLPCGNAEPTSSFSDGLVDDNVDPI